MRKRETKKERDLCKYEFNKDSYIDQFGWNYVQQYCNQLNRGFKRLAHENRKSMLVDQIEADVVISNGTESLFSFISRIQESGT